MNAYRVFVAYSHNDEHIRTRVIGHLKSIGAKPTWDEELPVGMPFHVQIKKKIAYAHIFMPILTESASERAWVHQEIGFATALNIPVLPLAIGKFPEALVEAIQAIVITEDLHDLEQRLTDKRLSDAIEHAMAELPATFECAAYPEQRNKMLVQYASEVLQAGDDGRVRHSSAFSTFSIPDRDVTDEIWGHREGSEPRPVEARAQLLGERQKFDKLSRAYGCELILCPFVAIQHMTKDARDTRLRILRDYLTSVSDEQVRAIIASPTRVDGNLHIVGDRFFAESFAPRPGGFRQTMFTRHAPTVIKRVHEFDSLFSQLLTEYAEGGKSSRRITLERIESAL